MIEAKTAPTFPPITALLCLIRRKIGTPASRAGQAAPDHATAFIAETFRSNVQRTTQILPVKSESVQVCDRVLRSFTMGVARVWNLSW
jgi:hypothetical protein